KKFPMPVFISHKGLKTTKMVSLVKEGIGISDAHIKPNLDLGVGSQLFSTETAGRCGNAVVAEDAIWQQRDAVARDSRDCIDQSRPFATHLGGENFNTVERRCVVFNNGPRRCEDINRGRMASILQWNVNCILRSYASVFVANKREWGSNFCFLEAHPRTIRQ